MADLHTPAWLLLGLTGSVPGVLSLAEGRLSYRTEYGTMFDAPLAEVTGVSVPWYYFGGGLKLTAEGEAYRFSFVQPNAALPVPAHLHPEGAHVGIGAGRRAGAEWKRALGA